MMTKEELGGELLTCLQEVTNLLRRAHAATLEQQSALVKNDAEVLVRTTRAQEDLLRRISECDRRAADAATDLASFAGIDPDKVDTETVSQAAGQHLAPRIASELSEVSRLADEVKRVSEINHKLISNGLEIIGCCLRTVACERSPGQYSKNAEVVGNGPCILSLNSKA